MHIFTYIYIIYINIYLLDFKINMSICINKSKYTIYYLKNVRCAVSLLKIKQGSTYNFFNSSLIILKRNF